MKNTKFGLWAEQIKNNWTKRTQEIKKLYPFGPNKEYLNEEGFLHRVDGPALITPTRCIWYQDGRKHGIDITIFGSIHFFYEGIMVPSNYIQNPKELNLEDILQEQNAEVRYVGMKIYGYDRLKDHKKVKLVHKDEKTGYELYSCNFDRVMNFNLVKVYNSTPELDGSFKAYYLQVPPSTKTCQEAVAWTFRMDAKEYQPEVET